MTSSPSALCRGCALSITDGPTLSRGPTFWALTSELLQSQTWWHGGVLDGSKATKHGYPKDQLQGGRTRGFFSILRAPRRPSGGIYRKFHHTRIRFGQIKGSLSRGPSSQAWWGRAPVISALRRLMWEDHTLEISSGCYIPPADLRLTTQLGVTLNTRSPCFRRTQHWDYRCLPPCSVWAYSAVVIFSTEDRTQGITQAQLIYTLAQLNTSLFQKTKTNDAR